MDRDRYWSLILNLCEEAQDDTIWSLRVQLLNEFGTSESTGVKSNMRNLAVCLKTFIPRGPKIPIPPAPQNLPMILFPASTGSNMLNLLPVAREAQRRGMLGGIVTRAPASEELGEFEHVMTGQALQHLAGTRLLPGFFRQACCKLKRLIELLNKRDSGCARRIKQNYGRMIRMMVESERMSRAFKELLPVWKPSCVISTSDFWPFEFQCYCQAKHMGIPTALLQHGDPRDVIIWPTYAETFLIWGEMYREKLLGLGATAERLRITGMPAADELFARCQQTGSRRQNGSKPVCVILSHAQERFQNPHPFIEYGSCLMELFHLTPAVVWKIKLHPSEDDSFYRELGISKFKNVEIFSPSISLDRAVEDADVVCTIRSTAGLQAMMMQKPLIVIVLDSDTLVPVEWPLQGGGIYARNAGEFKAHLDRLIAGADEFRNSLLASQRKFLEKSFTNRGRAATAVVDFLEEQTLARCRFGVQSSKMNHPL